VVVVVVAVTVTAAMYVMSVGRRRKTRPSLK
jgi:hypothetical protein